MLIPDSNPSNAARMSAACRRPRRQLHNFRPFPGENANRVRPPAVQISVSRVDARNAEFKIHNAKLRYFLRKWLK
jgi:hypothetical protein